MKKLFTLIIALFMLGSSVTFSQGLNPGQAQKRLALVIGNGNYSSSVLANPENDARSMAAVLKKLGFTVLKYENLTQNQMKKAIDDFGISLKNYDVGLFYYAGHGIQAKGTNFLIPVDAELKTEAQVEYDCVQADRVLAFMEESGAKVKILILDACRDNPFERSWTRAASGRGLVTMDAPGGSIIAYSTSPGKTAGDGSGNNSPYTSAILESIQIPDITITQMFQNVTKIVNQKSGKQQTPWIASSLTGDFYFLTDNQLKTGLDVSNTNSSENESKTNETRTIKAPARLNSSLQHLRNFEILSNFLKTSPRSYTEKKYTVINKFGVWTPDELLQKTEVMFDESGLLKDVTTYKGDRAKFDRKWIYTVSGDSNAVKVVEYDFDGATKSSYDIFLLNDTTIKYEDNTVFIANNRLILRINKKFASKETCEYNKEGFQTSKREELVYKKIITTRKFEYPESDKSGNWVKRLDYEDSSKPQYMTVREYNY
jgi:hypothetical protein